MLGASKSFCARGGSSCCCCCRSWERRGFKRQRQLGLRLATNRQLADKRRASMDTVMTLRLNKRTGYAQKPVCSFTKTPASLRHRGRTLIKVARYSPEKKEKQRRNTIYLQGAKTACFIRNGWPAKLVFLLAIWSAFLFLFFVLFVRRCLPFLDFCFCYILVLVDAVQAGCSSTASPPPLHNLTNNFLLPTPLRMPSESSLYWRPMVYNLVLVRGPCARHTHWYLAVGIGGRDAANKSVCLSTARIADYRKASWLRGLLNRPLHLPATAFLLDSSTQCEKGHNSLSTLVAGEDRVKQSQPGKLSGGLIHVLKRRFTPELNNALPAVARPHHPRTAGFE